MGWDYCCCAIPVLNVGAYFTLSEQFVLGILVGTLSFATPTLVGASVPFSFAYLILLALGYIFAAVQLVGFIGIFKEKPALFRRYVTINSIVLYVGFSAAATFLGLSAARHSQAVTACENTFFAGESTSTTEDTKGEQICNIFCWATLGVMGALWLLLFIVQSYLVLVLRNYGVSQRADHTKYHSIYSAHDGGDNNIMLNNVRSGTNGDDEAWNTRPSTDSWHNGPRPGHGYTDNEPVQYQIPPAEKGTGYGVGAGTGVLHVGPSKQASVDQAYLEHPSKADEAAAPLVHAQTGSKSDFYDPAGAPPSYHGHGSEAHDRGGPSVPAWQQQQPFNPYQSKI